MSHKKPLTVAIQMDPIESINIDTDSTFVLALEAQARGYRLFHYLPKRWPSSRAVSRRGPIPCA